MDTKQFLEQEVREHVRARLGQLEEGQKSISENFSSFRVATSERLDSQDRILSDIHKFVKYKSPGLFCHKKKLKILPIVLSVVTLGIAAAYHWYHGDFFVWVWELN